MLYEILRKSKGNAVTYVGGYNVPMHVVTELLAQMSTTGQRISSVTGAGFKAIMQSRYQGVEISEGTFDHTEEVIQKIMGQLGDILIVEASQVSKCFSEICDFTMHEGTKVYIAYGKEVMELVNC